MIVAKAIVATALFLACSVSIVRADTDRSGHLVISLDVPSSDVPGYLCVVSKTPSCAKARRDSHRSGQLPAANTADNCDTVLASNLPLKAAEGVDSPQGKAPAKDRVKFASFLVDDAQIIRWSDALTQQKTNEFQPIINAIKTLSDTTRKAADRTLSCADTHPGCAPVVRLPESYKDDSKDLDSTLTMICGENTVQSHRVAFVYLDFQGAQIPSGVRKVSLVGTSATLSFRDPLGDTTFPNAQILGGDYVPDTGSKLGTNERLQLTLRPRCNLVQAVLPPLDPAATVIGVSFEGDRSYPVKDRIEHRVAELASVPGSGAALLKLSDARNRLPRDVATSVPTADLRNAEEVLEQTAPPVCVAQIRRNSFSILVPAQEPTSSSALTVAIKSGEHEPLMATAQWFGAPSSNLALALEELEFDWQKNCLWRDSDTVVRNAASPALEKLSSDCPIASVSGSSCTVQATADTCSYRCAVPKEQDRTLPLPAKVHFTRQMADRDTVYSWDDSLEYSGEVLKSFAAPEDRRVIVDLGADWNDENWGDALDELRFVLPSGAIANIDLTSESAEDSKKRTKRYAVPTPNVTCGDQLRVAVFGTREYSEQAVAVVGGHIQLKPLPKYRQRWHMWGIAGIGVASPLNQNQPSVDWPEEFADNLQLGVNAEIYINSRPLSVEISVLSETGKAGYGVPTEPGVSEVWFDRFSVGAGLEWWATRRWHFGGSAFGTLGLPLFNSDDSKIGAVDPSYGGELNFRYRPGGNRMWLELVHGWHIGEQHPFYNFDTNTSTFAPRRLYLPYVALRIRFKLG